MSNTEYVCLVCGQFQYPGHIANYKADHEGGYDGYACLSCGTRNSLAEVTAPWSPEHLFEGELVSAGPCPHCGPAGGGRSRVDVMSVKLTGHTIGCPQHDPRLLAERTRILLLDCCELIEEMALTGQKLDEQEAPTFLSACLAAGRETDFSAIAPDVSVDKNLYNATTARACGETARTKGER